MVGKRVLPLAFLEQYIGEISEHAASCGSRVAFLGESHQYGLASILVSKCTKCNKILQDHTASKVLCDKKITTPQTLKLVLGQISTGGGASYLEEEMVAIQVPTMRSPVFV